jgi:hypothetical protein
MTLAPSNVAIVLLIAVVFPRLHDFLEVPAGFGSHFSPFFTLDAKYT